MNFLSNTVVIVWSNVKSYSGLFVYKKRIYDEVFIGETGLNIDFSSFELINEKIDFAESFKKLLVHHLRSLLQHVYDTSYDNVDVSQPQQPGEPARTTWSSHLFKKFHDLIEKIVLLSRACVRNADTKFTQVVSQKLRQAVVSQNMVNSPMFYGIFENFIQTQVQQTLTGKHWILQRLLFTKQFCG